MYVLSLAFLLYIVDPNIPTREEKFTPLHLAAFHSQHHTENGRHTNRGNLSPNVKILLYLKEKKVEVLHAGLRLLLSMSILLAGKCKRSVWSLSIAFSMSKWKQGCSGDTLRMC
jgi:hypothetical protein